MLFLLVQAVPIYSTFAEKKLFNHLPPGQVGAASKSDKSVKSQSRVRIDVEKLKNNVNINLPGHTGLQAVIEQKISTAGKSRYLIDSRFGEINKAGKKGFISLSAAYDAHSGEEVLNGYIKTPQGKTFLIKQSGNNEQELIEIDESRQLGCSGSLQADHLHSENSRHSTWINQAEAGSQNNTTINLLIAYTPDALSTAGSSASMQALINNMVVNTNLAHSNSATGIVYAISGTHLLSESSSDNFFNDINNAVNHSSGKWDELASLREQHCADQVVVIVGGTSNNTICGIALLGATENNVTPSKNSMFSIVSANQVICNYLTFAHELSHNLGAQHDYNNSAQNAVFGSAYGHRFVGSSANQYRTVMAYAPGARIPYFSNPHVNYEGTATGTQTANNAHTLTVNGAIVANFYSSETCSSYIPGPSPTPPINTSPLIEPDKINLSTRIQSNRANFTVKAVSNGKGAKGVTISVFFNKKAKGNFSRRIARVKTNAKGIRKFSKQRKRGFYVACHEDLCSRKRRLR